MRALRETLGANTALTKLYFGRFPTNGAAAPAAWTAGGKGMAVPTYPATGKFSIVLTDPPGGVLVGWFVQNRAATIADAMHCYGGTWDSTTNTFSFWTAVAATPQTAAAPPSATTDDEYSVILVFCQSENL